MKTLSVKRKHVMCDGCENNNAVRKLVFNNLVDSVYMCEKCFEKLKNAASQAV